jgi:hypothetical protein
MTSLPDLLERLRDSQLATGRFRGLLYVLVGGRIVHGETVISQGLTWREAAALLKRVRWDREAVRELGLEPSDLPPRDREKYWYEALRRAGLGEPEARAQGEELMALIAETGYRLAEGG